MRAALILLVALAAGCATDSDLALLPAPGADLSGHWRLNVVDSDDPVRLMQAMAGGVGAGPADQGSGGGQRSGRGRSGGNRGADPNAQLSVAQPVSISSSVMADLLHWPGGEVEIHQDGGVATFNSDGDSRVYRPNVGSKHAPKKDHRSQLPSVCGWTGASLVVQVEAEDNQPGFDAQYRVTDDGARLVQLITLQGGRLTGFTMSRVWDRE